jgi:hypothetical protein
MIHINLSVTILTRRSVFDFIPMLIGFAVPMHFFGGMTRAAFQVFFMVNVRFETLVFSEILPAYPAPMTGGAGLFYGGLFLEDMPLHEPSSHRIRSTDMASPATRVTFTTIVVKGLV